MLAEEHIRRGMPPEQARRAARLELGGVTQLREAHREERGVPFLDTLLQDLHYTFRTLRRDAGFIAFAILIVGLGIGAGSTVFSVITNWHSAGSHHRVTGAVGDPFYRPQAAQHEALTGRHMSLRLRCASLLCAMYMSRSIRNYEET